MTRCFAPLNSSQHLRTQSYRETLEESACGRQGSRVTPAAPISWYTHRIESPLLWAERVRVMRRHSRGWGAVQLTLSDSEGRGLWLGLTSLSDTLKMTPSHRWAGEEADSHRVREAPRQEQENRDLGRTAAWELLCQELPGAEEPHALQLWHLRGGTRMRSWVNACSVFALSNPDVSPGSPKPVCSWRRRLAKGLDVNFSASLSADHHVDRGLRTSLKRHLRPD